MGDLVERDGWWVPAVDRECFPAVQRQVHDIDAILPWVGRRKHVVQAGGNLGLWPVALAEHFDNVSTFEPDRDNFHALLKNLDAHEAENVQASRAALGSVVGLCTVDRFIPSNVGAHRIDEDPGGDVDLLRMDDLLLAGVDLLQLDVEGSEHDALLGGEGMIREFRPVVVLELKGLGARYGYPDEATHDLMRSWGYGVAARVHRDVVFTHGD